MGKLATVAISILLPLALNIDASAYSGSFDGSTPPNLLQFESAHGARSALEVLREDRLNTPSSTESSAPTPAAPDQQQTASAQFQAYFDSHVRAHWVLDAATHHRLHMQ